MTTSPTPKRTYALILAKKMTLSDRERHEFAEKLIGHAGSWSRLNEADAGRIVDGLEGATLFQFLLGVRNERAVRRG